jgi:hypothetical protein
MREFGIEDRFVRIDREKRNLTISGEAQLSAEAVSALQHRLRCSVNTISVLEDRYWATLATSDSMTFE